jgi:hypothetical protein
MKKTIYRTIFTVEVLSDEPINTNLDLSDLNNECTFGDYSGSTTKGDSKPLKGIKAARAVIAQGSSPDFFMMDDQGNELED